MSATNVEETTDYLPYGTARIDNKATSYSEVRKFAGHEYDVGDGLSYMGARYYDPNTGRFLSEDPMFLGIGDQGALKSIGTSMDQVLADPQNLNSYSYARNNPIIHTDPDGKCVEDLCIGEGIVAAIALFAPQASSYLQSLSTPLGQFGVSQSIDNAKAGHYGWAAVGAVTSGQLPEENAGVNLLEHEGVQIGDRIVGHTIAEHVGKTVEELSSRLSNTPGLLAASAFSDLETANSAVSKVVSENASHISDWLGSAEAGSFSPKFTANLGEKVGTYMSQGSKMASDAYSASMRLFKTPAGKAIIHTAFPHN